MAAGYFLLIAVFWVVGAIINMAVVRAVLEPERGAYAYMRLGPTELWLMLANFVLFILYTIASTALAIPMGLVMAFVLMTWRDAVPFVQLPMQMVSWGMSIWLGLRFCMVAPLIFNDRRFRLFESWTLTRGHVWNLFGVGLVMVLATAVVYLVLAGVGLAVAWPMFHSVAALGSPRAFFAQAPPADLEPALAVPDHLRRGGLGGLDHPAADVFRALAGSLPPADAGPRGGDLQLRETEGHGRYLDRFGSGRGFPAHRQEAVDGDGLGAGADPVRGRRAGALRAGVPGHHHGGHAERPDRRPAVAGRGHPADVCA